MKERLQDLGVASKVQVGDVVIGRDRRSLFCGTGIYRHAICIQVEPELVLASEHGCMRWGNMNREDVEVICQAHPEIVEKAMRRLRH